MKNLYHFLSQKCVAIILFSFIFSSLVFALDEKLTIVKNNTELAMPKQQTMMIFESETCGSCKAFEKDVTSQWDSPVVIKKTFSPTPPANITLKEPVWATPTIVMIEDNEEIGRFTGYDGNTKSFWKWFGMQVMTDEQKKIAFENGTEPPFSGSLLDNKDPGYYVDPITGDRLFRSDAKFKSGTGWPSFFDPIPGSLVFKEDGNRVEVLSASSGIHLGHVFDDGPKPKNKRYCINSLSLTFKKS